MEPNQSIENITSRLQQAQEEGRHLKEKIDTKLKQKKIVFQKVQGIALKVASEESKCYAQSYKLKKEKQNKEEELADWKNIAASNKEDLLQRLEELRKMKSELAEKNKELDDTKVELYENLKKQRIENMMKERLAAQNKGPKTLEEICAMIKIEKKEQFLTFNSLRQIFDGLVAYISPSFCELSNSYKKNRREKSYSNKELIGSFLEFGEKITELIGIKQKELLDKLNVPFNLLITSINYNASQGNQEALKLHATLVTRLRNSQLLGKPLTKEGLKKVLNLKEEISKNKKDSLAALVKECEKAKLTPDKIFSILQLQVSDEVHKQLGIEEEEVLKAMALPENANDNEVKELKAKFMKATSVLVKLK